MKAGILLGALFWLVVGGVILCATRGADALDYQIMAERPGALLRADEPNAKRTGLTFPSHADCLVAINSLRSEAGWRLRCRPIDRAPVPKLKVEK